MFCKKKNNFYNVIKVLSEVSAYPVIQKLAEEKRISFDEKSHKLSLNLPFYAPQWLKKLQQDSFGPFKQLFEEDVQWQVTEQVLAVQKTQDKRCLANIKNIIVVASGKGGVGKSTVSVNLALALLKNGAKVGMLDADIYGPSLPTLLGVKNAQPSSCDGKLMRPIHAHGLVCNSIGFLVKDAEAMIWRGPMASKALQQVLNETDWPELDYLIVDMPPGTGDIQLTMSQNVPVSSAVIVTTAQDVALIDAQKGVTMFNKVDVHISGIIENMSMHTCTKCGHKEAIFGSGGGEKLAEQFSLPFLGVLPLDINYRIDSDAGIPTVVKNERTDLVQPYFNLAEKLVIRLYCDLLPASQNISIMQVKS